MDHCSSPGECMPFATREAPHTRMGRLVCAFTTPYVPMIPPIHSHRPLPVTLRRSQDVCLQGTYWFHDGAFLTDQFPHPPRPGVPHFQSSTEQLGEYAQLIAMPPEREDLPTMPELRWADLLRWLEGFIVPPKRLWGWLWCVPHRDGRRQKQDDDDSIILSPS